MENLRELMIRNNNDFDVSPYQISQFQRTKSQLEVFKFIGFNDMLDRNVVNALTENSPKLREFTDIYIPSCNLVPVQCQIEELEIRADFPDSFDLLADDSSRYVGNNLSHFDRFKSVRLQVTERSRFKFEFILKLSSAQVFHVKSTYHIHDIYKVVDMAENLNSISV